MSSLPPSSPPKAPPRFVPTLTDVVRLDDTPALDSLAGADSSAGAAPDQAPSPLALAGDEPNTPVWVAPPPWAPGRHYAFADADPAESLPLHDAGREPGGGSSSSSRPDRGDAAAPAAAASPEPQLRVGDALQGPFPPVPPSPLPHGFEEHLVHRVMQRVDVVLDQRLREAIATVVQEQTRSMVPRLREEVESVVRHAVYEAVADELSGDHSAPM